MTNQYNTDALNELISLLKKEVGNYGSFENLTNYATKTAKHFKLNVHRKGKIIDLSEAIKGQTLYNIARNQSATKAEDKFHYALINCIKKIPEYIEESGEDNILYKDFKKSFWIIFKEKIKKIIEDKKPYDIYEEKAKEFSVDKLEFIQFLVSNPIILFSYIDERFSSIKKGKKETYVSHLYHFNTEKDFNPFKESSEDFDDFYNSDNDINFCKCSGFVLGHSLSPVSENICLLFELGRFKRIASIFGKSHEIYLTSVEWASYNRSAIEIFDDIESRQKRLEECIYFRKELYNKLGIKCNVLDISQNELLINGKRINSSNIMSEAKEFTFYSNLLKEIKIKAQESTKNKIVTIIDILNNSERKSIHIQKPYPKELTLLSFSIFEDKKNLFIIRTIGNHFNSFDTETFYYTLLQRYYQHHYSGWIKMAVESERLFDAAFVKLDKVDGFNEIKLGALYYQHYYFAVDSLNRPLNVIPYTFPSGRVWLQSKEDAKNQNKNKLEIAKDNVILLWDVDNTKRKNKIKNLIFNINLVQLAIQMSDLFSFCNYYFNEENDEGFWIGYKDKDGKDHIGLYNILDRLDSGECANSWKQYKENSELEKLFCQYFLFILYDEIELPYFFYPYIYVKKAFNDKQFERKLREIFIDIVVYVLEEFHLKINVKEWGID